MKTRTKWYNRYSDNNGSPETNYFMIYRREMKLTRSGALKCYSLEAAIDCATRLGWPTIKGVGKYQSVQYSNGAFDVQKC